MPASHHSLHHLFINSPAIVPSIISLSAILSPFPPSSLYQQPSHRSLPFWGGAVWGFRVRAMAACAGHHNEKSPAVLRPQGSHLKKAATYSPTLHCSTIGASGLNFSVRNGKRWDPAAITT